MITKFNNFSINEELNAERLIVINKILDSGVKLTDIHKSLMKKLTTDLTIGQLLEEEQSLYYEILRGKKEDKYTRNKLWNTG